MFLTILASFLLVFFNGVVQLSAFTYLCRKCCFSCHLSDCLFLIQSNCLILLQLVIEEDKKFLKLLEILGHYQEKGSVIIFVDKQEHADALLKDLMKASYPCMSLHGGTGRLWDQGPVDLFSLP